MKIIPLNDRLIVRREADEAATTPGGIIIPDTAKEKPQRGIVLSAGPAVPDGIGEGDLIMFGKYAGTEVKINGEDLLILHQADVMARIA